MASYKKNLSLEDALLPNCTSLHSLFRKYTLFVFLNGKTSVLSCVLDTDLGLVPDIQLYLASCGGEQRKEASPPASPIYDWMSVFFTLTLLCTSMVYSSRETKVSSGYLNVMICSNIAIHVALQCASMYCSDYFFYVILERFMRRTSSFNCMLASEKHINRRTSCAFS